MIEFGEHGPLSRFCLHHETEAMRKSVGQVLADAGTYLRVSRQALPARLWTAVCQVFRRLSRETTILFRIGVMLMLAVLAALVYQQYRMNLLLQAQIESGNVQLESFARALARAREEAPSSSAVKVSRISVAVPEASTPPEPPVRLTPTTMRPGSARLTW